MKRLELVIFLIIGLSFFPIGIYYHFGFLKKNDHLDDEAFRILNESIEINKMDVESDFFKEVFNVTCASTGIRKKMQKVRDKQKLPGNHLFAHILYTVLFMKRVSQTVVVKTFRSNVTCPVFRISSSSGAEISYVAHPNVSYMTEAGAIKIDRLEELQFDYAMFGDNISEILFRRAVYGDGLSDGQFTVTVFDANGQIDLKFPAMHSATFITVGIFIDLICIILILVFIWHCWSVSFIIIRSVIQRSARNHL